jgi:hypothetical protein
MRNMLRFSLSTALLSLTCFCVAATAFRLLVVHYGGGYTVWLLVAGSLSTTLGFGVLVNRIPLSIFLGFLISVILVYGRLLVGP